MSTINYRHCLVLSALCLLLASVSIPLSAASKKASKSAEQSPKFNLVEVAASAGKFKTLLAAAGAADLIPTLRSDGPFTVFAPTDEAFAKLPKGTIAELLKPENKAKLAAILTYHVVPGKVKAEQAVQLSSAKTANGKQLKLKVVKGDLMINNAKVIKADVLASNGVIHIIDSVLLPPSDKKQKLSGKEATMALIEKAIERGVPQYNSGNTRACADIYEITVIALMNMDIPVAFKQALEKAHARASGQHDSAQRAWTYRYAFDAILKKGQDMALMR